MSLFNSIIVFLRRIGDVSETFTIMAAEGSEEMSGNGELEEPSGSLKKP